MIKKLIILAAGQGTRLRPITNSLPKCLTPVRNKSILKWQIEVAESSGIEEIIVVGGYKAEKIDSKGIKIILNDSYKTSNMVESLRCAEKEFNGGFILSYGDIIYEEKVLKSMMCLNYDISVASDMEWLQYWSQRFSNPLIDAERFKLTKDNIISQVGGRAKNYDEIDSQYIGLGSFSSKGSDLLKKWFLECYEDENMYVTDMLDSMIKAGQEIKANRINRGWLEIDSLKDLEIAESNLTINSNGSIEILK